jgi:hypothetical protein
LIVASRSVAEDLSYVALADVAGVVEELGVREWRLIGGHMVLLHVYRHGLGADLYRATVDADLGIPPFVARTGGVIEALETTGYVRVSGNRFRRRVVDLGDRPGDEYAVVDVLVPAYTSHPRENHFVSEKLTTTEVPGLALALTRPPVEIAVDVSLWSGGGRSVGLLLPDEISAFVLKALAWRQRQAGKDAVDVWRMLEVLVAGDHHLGGIDADVDVAVDVVHDGFRDPDAPAAAAFARERQLSERALQTSLVRIQALKKRVAA